VGYGEQMGTVLGFPTANLQLRRLRTALAGVYAVRAQLQSDAAEKPEHWYPAVANVGTRPTVNQLTRAILEVHLLDETINLYGQHMEVRFIEKMRNEQHFETLELLKQQIACDIERARRILGNYGHRKND
jgi:riboflavin kinase/FMN adenylyltransferase